MKRTGLKRQGSEEFFTKPEIAKICVETFTKYVKLEDTDIIYDPCCGAGVFPEQLKMIDIRNEIIFSDIQPLYVDSIAPSKTELGHDSRRAIILDYLNDDIIVDLTRRIHVISNVPFGRQSCLAKKFIKRSSYAQTISFILPKSFKKTSYQKSFPKNFHLLHSLELPDNSFILDNNEHKVPCVFQIWEKRNYERVDVSFPAPTWLEYVKRTDSPDFAIRRVGGTAGSLYASTAGEAPNQRFKEKNVQTHYFIKVSMNHQAFINEYKKVVFVFDNSVGAKSISKSELNEKLLSLPPLVKCRQRPSVDKN